MPHPLPSDMQAASLFLALLNRDVRRNCLLLGACVLAFSGCIPCTYVSSSRVFAFFSSVGPQSGQPRFQELVSCNIIPGSLGSKILPCRELLGDRSFLHSFPKEEKNGFKVHTAG